MPPTTRLTCPALAAIRIETWYPANTGYNAATPYIVFSSSGNQTVNINQQSGGGAWRAVGTFSFNAGSQSFLAISRWISGTQLRDRRRCADH